MVRRRRTQPAGIPEGGRKPDTTGPITSASPPSDSLAFADSEPLLPVPSRVESVHDALLESVSPEALQLHDDTPKDPSTETVEEAVLEPEPPAAANAKPVLQGASDSAPSEVFAEEPSATDIAVPTRAVAAPAFRKASALDAISEWSESNATVVAFLRNEGSATLAHWRSLATARSTADVVRLQVDEMQRAADASLTCISTLARRAGRLANLLGRR